MSTGEEQTAKPSEEKPPEPPPGPGDDNQHQSNLPKPVPYWLEYASKGAQIVTAIINVFVLVMVFNQFRLNREALELNRSALDNNQTALELNKRAIDISEKSFKLTDEATDRVWAAQLIQTIYELVDCPKRDKRDCPPKASFRSREEAAVAYIKLQVERREHIKLADANLSGMVFPERAILSQADLSKATLSGASLVEAQIQDAKLFEADLSSMKLKGAHLKGAVLSRAHLQSADLDGANLEGAHLDDANLQGDCKQDVPSGRFPGSALLRRAKLANAVFRNARVCGVDVSGTDLSEAKDLTQIQIDVMKGDPNTIPPRGLTRPSHWGGGGQP